MKTFLKIMVAAMVAMGMACVLIAADASDNMVIVTFFCVGIMTAAALGVFDEREKSKHESIKHYDGRRNYGHAAVFVGGCYLHGHAPAVRGRGRRPVASRAAGTRGDAGRE